MSNPMTSREGNSPAQMGGADIAKIAAGLTKAQREAFCHPSQGPFTYSIYSLTSAACRCALQRKGLVVDRMYATALTPLGRQVAAHLKEPTP